MTDTGQPTPDRKQQLVSALESLIWREEQDWEDAAKDAAAFGDPATFDVEGHADDVTETKELLAWLQLPSVQVVEGSVLDGRVVQQICDAARKAHALIGMLTDGVLEDAGTDEDEALEVYDALEHALQLMDNAVHADSGPSNPRVLRSPTVNDV